jgi:hypothetical protein
MEASIEDTAPAAAPEPVVRYVTDEPAVTESVTESVPEPTLTAKQMAAAEEENLARLKALSDAMQVQAEQANAPPELTIGELALQGHEAIEEAMRKHNAQPPLPPYIPPPRTPRQMTALEQELEAGRRAQQRAEEQQRSRPVEAPDMNKEGFTTPVYRPDNMVPDPMLGDRLQPITAK